MPRNIHKDDPKRLAARDARERTARWLDVLGYGFGGALKHACGIESVEDIWDLMNEQMPRAIAAAKIAEDEYRPYWSRRRVHRWRRSAQATGTGQKTPALKTKGRAAKGKRKRNAA